MRIDTFSLGILTYNVSEDVYAKVKGVFTVIDAVYNTAYALNNQVISYSVDNGKNWINTTTDNNGCISIPESGIRTTDFNNGIVILFKMTPNKPGTYKLKFSLVDVITNNEIATSSEVLFTVKPKQ